MECAIHKCEISMFCMAKECMSALCYKCLLKHNPNHESLLFEYKKLAEIIKKNPALFSFGQDEIKSIIGEMQKKIDILSQALLKCTNKCNLFTVNDADNQPIPYYFCRGSKNGCLKKNEAVWGTTFYTADSDLCLAAKHAGFLKDDGGVCLVEFQNGLDQYHASLLNGVQTKSYGKYEKTIVFKKIF